MLLICGFKQVQQYSFYQEPNMKVSMKQANRLLALIVIGFSFSLLCAAQDAAAPQPDNTKVNQRDSDQSRVTSDQQNNNDMDRKLTQQIRQSIMQDKSLSTYAHNVKIITQNGMVTLKGPVRSAEEKQAIETKAAAVAGDGKVNSQIEIKSN
jgi:hyperosmotically inducible periplasmic protein